jgi:hypothetical protein
MKKILRINFLIMKTKKKIQKKEKIIIIIMIGFITQIKAKKLIIMIPIIISED